MKSNQHYKIDRDEGLTTAKGDVLNIAVMGESTVFHRNGIKQNLKTGETTHVRYLVCELNGVRIYVNGADIVMTTEDMNP